MMKAKINNVIVLGLSHENIKKLMEGKPIKFNLKELNSTKPQPGEPILPEMDVLIFAAKDESKMIDMLHPYIDGNTEIK